MHVCMHACMHACVHVCMLSVCVCMHACMHACMRVGMCVCVCMHACMHAWTAGRSQMVPDRSGPDRYRTGRPVRTSLDWYRSGPPGPVWLGPGPVPVRTGAAMWPRQARLLKNTLSDVKNYPGSRAQLGTWDQATADGEKYRFGCEKIPGCGKIPF